MKTTHDWRGRMRGEFSDWQRWWGRALVVALAGTAGLTVVGFTWLSERAFGLFDDMRGLAWWSALIWTPWAPPPSSG